jgi:putative two-component system response regulator
MSENNRKFTILAVDDTPENLDVVKGIPARDYVVKVAINGPMALKIAEKAKTGPDPARHQDAGHGWV